MSKYIVARKADEAFTEREALIEIKLKLFTRNTYYKNNVSCL